MFSGNSCYYVPETIECFTGFTLLVVERELRRCLGMFLALREESGKKQLCSFLISYKGLDQTNTRQPDMQAIGRVRIMDSRELDMRRGPARKPDTYLRLIRWVRQQSRL